MSVVSDGRKGRICNGTEVVALSVAMVGGCLPEEFGVGATDVIRVEGKRVGKAVLPDQLVAKLADARGEERGDPLYRIGPGDPGRPFRRLGQAFWIGGEPVNLL